MNRCGPQLLAQVLYKGWSCPQPPATPPPLFPSAAAAARRPAPRAAAPPRPPPPAPCAECQRRQDGGANRRGRCLSRARPEGQESPLAQGMAPAAPAQLRLCSCLGLVSAAAAATALAVPACLAQASSERCVARQAAGHHLAKLLGQLRKPGWVGGRGEEARGWASPQNQTGRKRGRPACATYSPQEPSWRCLLSAATSRWLPRSYYPVQAWCTRRTWRQFRLAGVCPSSPPAWIGQKGWAQAASPRQAPAPPAPPPPRPAPRPACSLRR